MAETGFSIKLRAQDKPDAAPTLMKLKETTPFEKILNAFAKKREVAPTALRLMYNGSTITNMALTPKDLGMEDGDVIDVMLYQDGGAGWLTI